MRQRKNKKLSIDTAIDMLIILGKYWRKTGEFEKANIQFKIAQKVIGILEQDFQIPSFSKKVHVNNMQSKEKELNN